MSDISNLRDTIVPKSDQLNAEQLLGGPITITVTNVTRGTDDQPITIHYADDQGRPYKPCKSMRKVLVFAWGEDGHQWIGRSMTLFNNPEVMFGGVKVGGIRISHLSDIARDIQLSLTKTRGKKEQFVIQHLAADPKVEQYRQKLIAVAEHGVDKLADAWKKTPAKIRAALGEKFKDSLKESAMRETVHSEQVSDAAVQETITELNQTIVKDLNASNSEQAVPAADHF